MGIKFKHEPVAGFLFGFTSLDFHKNPSVFPLGIIWNKGLAGG